MKVLLTEEPIPSAVLQGAGGLLDANLGSLHSHVLSLKLRAERFSNPSGSPLLVWYTQKD